MSPKVDHAPLVVWPCRVAPDLLKKLQEKADKEEVPLGTVVDRELRKAVKEKR